jgi:hypothetical protein
VRERTYIARNRDRGRDEREQHRTKIATGREQTVRDDGTATLDDRTVAIVG